jgi:hypothetical protein
MSCVSARVRLAQSIVDLHFADAPHCDINIFVTVSLSSLAFCLVGAVNFSYISFDSADEG